MKPSFRLALVFGALLLTGCWNFDDAYNHYCSAVGCNDAGAGGGTGGGSGGGTGGGSGGGGGGGGGDGGTVDAGCLTYGSACTGYGQCCDAVDGGPANGFPMQCSRLNFCQVSEKTCAPDGYACNDSSQCCHGTCNGGRCSICGQVGDACASIDDCCWQPYYNYVGCNLSTGRCVGLDAAPGAACRSTDACDPFSSSNYCALDGGDGTCVPATSCTLPDEAPTGPKPCCAPMTTNGSGNCCMPDDSYCTSSGDCCSDNCINATCVPANAMPYPNAGDHCLYDDECGGGNNSPFWCDPVSQTCEKTWCFLRPTGNGKTGCCTWSNDKYGDCVFPDNTTCGLPFKTCTQNTDCCSNSCGMDTMGDRICDYPTFF